MNMYVVIVDQIHTAYGRRHPETSGPTSSSFLTRVLDLISLSFLPIQSLSAIVPLHSFDISLTLVCHECLLCLFHCPLCPALPLHFRLLSGWGSYSVCVCVCVCVREREHMIITYVNRC